MYGDTDNTYYALTKTEDSIKLRLISEIVIAAGGKRVSVNAQWDTGALGTLISTKVVRELSPPVNGTRGICSPLGEAESNIYVVDITMPDGPTICGVNTCEIKPDQYCDVIIGMDIISMGDFAVSNYNGKTTFTFRMPSQGVIDFTDP